MPQCIEHSEAGAEAIDYCSVSIVDHGCSLNEKRNQYRIFRTTRCTNNSLIFPRMERGPYSSVRLMCGSGCALSPSCEQILCGNKCYQRNCNYLNSFLRANLFLSCNQITYYHPLYKFVFSLQLLSFPSQVYFSLHFTCVNTHVRRACIAICT